MNANFKRWSVLRAATMRTATLLAMIFITGNALAQDAAAQFPDANRVVADYPEPAQAYVALNLLWDVLKAKAAESPDARAKRGSYYNTSTAIQQRFMVAGDKAATDFNERVRQLMSDKNFRSGVLAKYNVLAVPIEAPQRQNSGDVSDAMIKGAFYKALPVFLVTLVFMVLLTKAMVRNTTNSPTADSKTLPGDGLPALPESLRVVKVPGLQYTLGVVSAMVLDKESRTDTTVRTTVTQPQVYTMANQIHTVPGQVSTTVLTTQTDLVWVLTPQKQETSWTFQNSQFPTRAGHLISAVARCLTDGTMQFMAVYNHTTKQFVVLGSGAAHGTRGGRWALLLVSLAGGVGFGIALWIFLSIRPPEMRDNADRALYPVALFLMGLVAAVILELLIVLRVKLSVFRKRETQFAREYLPKFREFLEQRTGALEGTFR